MDGIDIDWEYPGLRGSPKKDKFKLNRLCKELRAAFKRESHRTHSEMLLLSLAIPASHYYLKPGFDLDRLQLYVDWFNLMAYDLHGSWENKTAHNTAMVNPLMNVSYGVDYLLRDHHIPSKQIVLGLATYGRSFTTKNNREHGVGVKTSGPGFAGRYTRQKGILAYFECCHLGHQVSHLDSDEKAPYCYLNDQWVGYDSPESIGYKVLMEVIRKKLKGTMFWDISLDDVSGLFCGHGRHPLLRAAKRILDRDDVTAGGVYDMISVMVNPA